MNTHTQKCPAVYLLQSNTHIYIYILWLISSNFFIIFNLVLNCFVLRIWIHCAFIDQFSNAIQEIDVIIPILQTRKLRQNRSKGLLQTQTEMLWQSMEYLDFLALTQGPSTTRSVELSSLFYKIMQLVDSSGSLPQVSDISLYGIQTSMSNFLRGFNPFWWRRVSIPCSQCSWSTNEMNCSCQPVDIWIFLTRLVMFLTPKVSGSIPFALSKR